MIWNSLLSYFLSSSDGSFSDALALDHHQRGVAAVVDDHIRPGAVRPGQHLFGAPPVILQRFAFPCENRGFAGGRNRCGGVVLRRKDIAGGPADIRAEASSVSISMAVWIVICSEPVIFSPFRGFSLTVFFTRVPSGRAFLFPRSAFPFGRTPPAKYPLLYSLNSGHISAHSLLYFAPFPSTFLSCLSNSINRKSIA